MSFVIDLGPVVQKVDIDLGPVVQKVDNAVQQINQYPADNC